MDVDATASDDGPRCAEDTFRPRPNSALEGQVPQGETQRFSRLDTVDLFIDSLVRARCEGWKGAAFCLSRNEKWCEWHQKSKRYKEVECADSDSGPPFLAHSSMSVEFAYPIKFERSGRSWK